MKFLKKYGAVFLILGALSDFLTPYGLGLFYPGMNQGTMVITIFGDVNSPVREAFKIWSVVSGILFVLAVPALYAFFRKIAPRFGWLPALCIALYGICDCMFTGLFSIDQEAASWTFSTWVHNIGSGVGYAGFLLFPAVVALVYQLAGKTREGRVYWLFLAASVLTAILYGLARIPALAHTTVFSQLGLWQRVSFFFNYLPILYAGVHIYQTRERL